jgi:hypothetical protein
MKFGHFVVLGIAIAASSAGAAETIAPKRPAIMATCDAAADARGLVGSDRRRFLAECLRLESRKLPELQVQMTSCEAVARGKGLRGDDLRAFMGRCMRA